MTHAGRARGFRSAALEYLSFRPLNIFTFASPSTCPRVSLPRSIDSLGPPLPSSPFEATTFQNFCLLVILVLGKSCLLLRFADDSYLDAISAIGVDFKIRTVEQDGKTIKLQFGILLGKSASGQSLAATTAELMESLLYRRDRPRKLQYVKQCKGVADEMGIPFMETRAKNAINVEQAFMAMAASIKDRMASQPARGQRKARTRSRSRATRQPEDVLLLVLRLPHFLGSL
ncbi:GTP-binding protein YPTM2 [Zea mays]|uniref:GTP-binding protein YPTM2 n=1 Tax=Zea mays TaxID=4577 RepID=A0A3L6DA89_MAIZE|nr:GTP-binding protein YPTM2 [Zea mays]